MKTASLIILVPLIAVSCFGDTLELKNGTLLQGSYMGGTSSTIRFQVANDLKVIPTSEVLALTFTGPVKEAAASPPTKVPLEEATSAATQNNSLTIPVGSSLIVSLRTEISTADATVGQKFGAILESDLKSRSVVVAPRGSLVRGTVTEVERPRRLRKIAALSLTLDEVVVDENQIRLVTQEIKTETKPDGTLVKGAASGAIIGEIVDDDAGKGALSGAAMGALKKGDHIVYESGSLLRFTLSMPATIRN